MIFSWKIVKYSNHLNTEDLNTRIIRIPESMGSGIQMVKLENWLFSVQFSDHHLNTRPFDKQTQIYHLNTRPVLYSNGYHIGEVVDINT